jgi:SpoVK/Ycf46/Vps4 family AAA+-type ATPase
MIMAVSSPLIEALRRSVAAAPDDVTLRLHLAEQLIEAGDGPAAVAEIAAALLREPTNPAGRTLMARALSAATPQAAAAPETPSTFDWKAAEQQVDDVVAPAFVDDSAAEPDVSAFRAERTTVTLADVAGMDEVKQRLQAAFLAPLRNPELRKLYGKTLRGGLLLYGPPGCGKTYIARAIAGELGAQFLPIALTDILDPYMGNSERNLHEAFQAARRDAPCVLFIDEVDSIGIKRSLTRNSAMRGTVNQLLTELDGVDGANDGVYILAATNQPWDVDPAFRRPGRLDRTLLVLPPDAAAREAIFRMQLRDRPVEGIDAKRLAGQTDGFSGADVVYLCELAAERALLDSVRSGTARLITMADLQAARSQVNPSIGGWLDSARNVVLFGNDDGTYDELRRYLKRAKRL